MIGNLAPRPPPAEDAGVRFAEILAALVDRAQKKDPTLRLEDLADKAKVHRVTLTNIVNAARKGRPRTVDEETFWQVCREIGLGPEDLFAGELREEVSRWRGAHPLKAGEAGMEEKAGRQQPAPTTPGRRRARGGPQS